MSAEQFTPTTEQVRHGFAVDPEAEYRDPLTNHTLYGERAFDRWLAKHDAEVKAQAVLDLAASYESAASIGCDLVTRFAADRAAAIRAEVK